MLNEEKIVHISSSIEHGGQHVVVESGTSHGRGERKGRGTKEIT